MRQMSRIRRQSSIIGVNERDGYSTIGASYLDLSTLPTHISRCMSSDTIYILLALMHSRGRLAERACSLQEVGIIRYGLKHS